MKEEFKPWILNPKYLISNLGRVYSKKRNKFLKPYPRQGYPTFGINVDGVTKNIMVHRAVALLFLDFPCPNFLRKEIWEQFNNGEKFRFYHEHGIVDHKDRNRENANLENLRWTTASENAKNTDIYESYNNV